MSRRDWETEPWRVEGLSTIPTVYAGNMRICDLRGWGYLTSVSGLDPYAAAAVQDDLARRISSLPELEAENARLREALEQIARGIDGGSAEDDEPVHSGPCPVEGGMCASCVWRDDLWDAIAIARRALDTREGESWRR